MTLLECSPRQGRPSVARKHCTVQGRLFSTDAALLKARHGPSISLNSWLSASTSNASYREKQAWAGEDIIKRANMEEIHSYLYLKDID